MPSATCNCRSIDLPPRSPRPPRTDGCFARKALDFIRRVRWFEFPHGRYVKQPAGYEAFIPAPLPPKPSVRISGRLQVLLSDATLALGRLDGSIHTLPNADSFAAANEVVKKLVGIGVLREMTGQRRDRSFRYDAYIDLFT
jgi:hypothetical protein